MHNKQDVKKYYYRVRPPVQMDILETSLDTDEKVGVEGYYFDSLRSSIVFFLYLIKKIRKLPKLKVGVQVYTCRSMLQAIGKSGNEELLHDINIDYYSSNPESIQYKELDVLILTHLFGIPNPHYEAIISNCKRNNVIVFEDLAMSRDMAVDGVPVGSMSDAYGYSFGFDKPISCYKGGKLIINNREIDNIARKDYDRLPQETNNKSKRDLLRLYNYYKMTAPCIADERLQFINLIEPFLLSNGSYDKINYYTNRFNSKLKILVSKYDMRPRKMGMSKIFYLEKSNRNNLLSLEERDSIGRELLKYLEKKYSDVVTPKLYDNCITRLHRPPIITGDSTRKLLLSNNKVQLGRYTWKNLLSGDSSLFPEAHYASNNMINIPNWTPEIIQYL